MSGPEHYRRAEELISIVDDGNDTMLKDSELLAMAQVHATLALAAATALLPFINPDSGSDGGDLNAWRETAGRQA